MKNWTRRDVLKSGVALPAAARHRRVGPGRGVHAGGAALRRAASGGGAGRRLAATATCSISAGDSTSATPTTPAKDFGFGSGRSGGFQKTGDFLSPSNLAYDDSDWKPVDLPHDWAIGLPFKNDPALSSKGFYPLGRDYPETSVGWYRRVFDLPASDAGGGSRSSSTAPTATRWSSSTATTSAGTAAATIRSAST